MAEAWLVTAAVPCHVAVSDRCWVFNEKQKRPACTFPLSAAGATNVPPRLPALPPPALQVHYTNYPASLADWEHALPMQARFFNALKVRTPQAAGTGLA